MSVVLEWLAFGGSMLCSILYGNGGKSGPISGIFVAIFFILYGYVSNVPAAIISNIFFLIIHARNLRKTHMEDQSVINGTTKKHVNRLTELCYEASKDSGWWDSPITVETVPAKIALIMSELGEAVDADRTDSMDSKLPHRKGLEVELADAMIRICDLAGRLDMDLGGAVAEKMQYNKSRLDHKRENRQSSGGKRY